MKPTLLFFILFLVFSCENSVTPEPVKEKNCKLTKAILSPYRAVEYSYTQDAKINQLRYLFGENQESVSSINLKRNDKGELISSNWLYNSDFDNEEVYTVVNGRITRVDYRLANGFEGTNEIIYNEQGLISRFTSQIIGTSLFSYDTFEYNEDSCLIKRTAYDDKDKIFFVDTVEPKVLHRSPESIAIASGVPFNLYLGLPIPRVLGGNGTIYKRFERDETGLLSLIREEVVSNAVVDNNGYLVSYDLETNDGITNTINKVQFLLDNCEE